jgi:large subunit ribosomal protein L25
LETLEIQAAARDKKRKRDAKRLLRNGKVPGILYGPKTQALALEFDKREFSTRIAGLEGSHLVRLKSASEALADKVALVKEMQFHPVRVPLHFVGKAAGVVRGGILQPIVREIEVECLPLDIPQFFDVDVSELDIGDSVHIDKLSMPEGVTAVSEPGLALVAVVPPTVEEAPAAPTEAVPVEGAEVAPVAPETAATEEGKS